MQQRMTLATQSYLYEPQVNMLYDTLKLLPAKEARDALLKYQARVPDGLKIIEGAMLLFVSKLQTTRNKERQKYAELPEYPGNQEDVTTIHYIESKSKKIKSSYKPVYDYLEKMIGELSDVLSLPLYRCETYQYQVYYLYQDLMHCNSQHERAAVMKRYTDRENGLMFLKQAADLAGALNRTTRKELWDKQQELKSEELTTTEAIIHEIAAVIPQYSPTLYARSSASSSSSTPRFSQ